MGEVVAVLAVMVGLVVGGAVLVALLIWRSLRRRNEVCPQRPVRAPMRWMLSPGTCARLHRRLRDSVAAMRLALPAPRARRLRRVEATPLAVLAAEIEAHAVALDGELMIAARRRGRAGASDRLLAQRQVEHLERSALRVVAEARGGARRGGESVDDALRRISEQLDARDAAWAEVSRIEREAGLRPSA